MTNQKEINIAYRCSLYAPETQEIFQKYEQPIEDLAENLLILFFTEKNIIVKKYINKHFPQLAEDLLLISSKDKAIWVDEVRLLLSSYLPDKKERNNIIKLIKFLNNNSVGGLQISLENISESLTICQKIKKFFVNLFRKLTHKKRSLDEAYVKVLGKEKEPYIEKMYGNIEIRGVSNEELFGSESEDEETKESEEIEKFTDTTKPVESEVGTPATEEVETKVETVTTEKM